MRKPVLTALLYASITSCMLGAAQAQSGSPPTADDRWMDVTVLTIAPDGTWGAATEPYINQAIGGAIADCKRRYARDIGCGHRLVTVRGGWSLVYRCGNENIIVAEKTLAAAEEQARKHEHELRSLYVPHMPACARTVTVDPRGAITATAVGH